MTLIVHISIQFVRFYKNFSVFEKKFEFHLSRAYRVSPDVTYFVAKSDVTF